jgi:tape measure domain-containing protein
VAKGGGAIEIPIIAGLDASDIQAQFTNVLNGITGAAEKLNKELGGKPIVRTIQLRMEADETGAKNLAVVEKQRLDIVDKLVQSYEKANKTQAGSLTSLRQQVNEAKQARDQIAKYVTSTGAGNTQVRQLNDDWAVANQRVARISRELDIASASTFWDRVKVGLRAEGLISFSNGLVQITQGLQAASILVGGFISQINNLVTAVAKIESFKLSFVAAGAGGTGGIRALEEASRIALGLGSNINVVRDGFQKLTPVVLNSGGSIGNVSQIAEALSSRFAAFGLSADSSRRVMNGVIQAFAKGKLQAEELTQQISEADPAFKTDFAGALGVTVQQLESLVKAGEINTQVLLDTLPKIGQSALLYGKLGTSAASAVNALDLSGKALGTVGVTTEQVRNQLDTLSQLNFERFAIAFQPVINAFLKAQAIIIDFITYITKLEGTKGLGNTIAAISQSVLNLLDALAKTAGVVATVISPFLELIGAIANTGPGITAITILLGVKLLAALKGIPAAISSSLGSFTGLSGVLGQATSKYLGLGTAAGTAAREVTAAQAMINAAQGAPTVSRGQLSLFGNAGNLYGTSGETKQLELALEQVKAKANGLFPTFSKAFAGIGSGANSAGQAIARLSTGLSNLSGGALERVSGASVKAFDSVAKGALTGVTSIANGSTAIIEKFSSIGASGTTLKSTLAGIFSASATGITEFGARLLGLRDDYDELTKSNNSTASSLSNINNSGTKAFGSLSNSISGVGNTIKTSLSAAVGSLTNFINSSAQLESVKNRAIQAANGIKSIAAGAVTGTINTLSTSLSGLDAALIGVQAGFIVFDQLMNQYNGVMSGAKEITNQTKIALTELNNELQKSNIGVQEQGNAWDASTQNIGSGAAVIDRVIRGLNAVNPLFKLATNEQVRYERATVAAYESSVDFDKAISKLTNKYSALKSAGDSSAQSQAEQKRIFDAISGAYASRISQLDAQIAKEKALAASSVEVREAKQQLITTLQAEKNGLLAEAQARGFATQAVRDQVGALGELVNQIRLTAQVEIDRLNTTKAQIENRYDNEIEKIDQVKTKEDERYQSEKERISSALERTNAYYDAQKQKIQEVRDAEAAAANDRIRRLQALTPAEQQLQQIRIASLQSQAAGGGRQGLEARAALERIQADQQIAAIQEQERQKDIQHKAQLVELEKQEADKKRALAEEERKNEMAHKEKIRAIELETVELKKQKASETEAIDQKVLDLQNQVKDATRQAADASGEFTGHLMEGSSVADTIKTKMLEIAKIAASIRIPSVGNNRFAGGHVTAGGQYTVNEFGKEMFLSSAGKLSEIKARPWGTWTAPSSGTVIPAHVAAGINIPKAGVKISREGGKLLDKTFSGPSAANRALGQMITVINASNNKSTNSDLAAVQAHQAIEIGKLGRAVSDLASKDWNVNVKVRNTGNAAYLEAINHRM